MKATLIRIFTIIPEIAIFVFIAVCTTQVIRKGGSAKNLIPLISVLYVNIYALKKVLRWKV